MLLLAFSPCSLALLSDCRGGPEKLFQNRGLRRARGEEEKRERPTPHAYFPMPISPCLAPRKIAHIVAHSVAHSVAYTVSQNVACTLPGMTQNVARAW